MSDFDARGEPLFKIPDMMGRWGCGSGKIYQMIRDGKLNAFKLGGTGPWLATLADVQKCEGTEVTNHETGEERALAALEPLRHAVRH